MAYRKPFLMLLVLMTGLCPTGVRAEELGWMLKQNTHNLGPTTTYISSNGIRIVFEANNFSFSCYGPKWDQILYNEKQKLIEKKPFSYWSTRGIKTPLSLNDNSSLRRLPQTRLSDALYAKHPSTVYLITQTDARGNPKYLTNSDFAKYIVSKDIHTHPYVIAFAQAVFDAPRSKNFPLKLSKFCRDNSYGFGMKYNQEKNMINLLTTSKVERIKNPDIKPALPLAKYHDTDQSKIIVNQKKFDEFFRYMYDKDNKREGANRH